MVFQSRAKIFRVGYSAYSITLAFILLATGSRGASLALFAFLVIYVLSIKVFREYRRIIIACALLAIAIVIVINFLPNEIYVRLFDLTSYTSDFSIKGARSDIWRTTILTIVPSMGVFGLGSGCGVVALQTVYGFMKGTHNTYLNMLLEYGVLGLPLFVSWIFVVGRRLKFNQNFYLLSLFIGMCVVIFFLDSYAKKFFWNAMMAIVILGQEQTKQIDGR